MKQMLSTRCYHGALRSLVAHAQCMLCLQTFYDETLEDGIGFDNIAAAMVSVIQILTYAGWSYMMYRFTDTYGIYAIIYSILCIVIGCYFVVSACMLLHFFLFV